MSEITYECTLSRRMALPRWELALLPMLEAMQPMQTGLPESIPGKFP